MSTPPAAAVRDLWNTRLATNNQVAAVAGLRALKVRDAGALTAIEQLAQALAYAPGTISEAGAWYQVLVSWPTGFPPAPSMVPLDRYPFDPMTGPPPIARFDPRTRKPAQP